MKRKLASEVYTAEAEHKANATTRASADYNTDAVSARFLGQAKSYAPSYGKTCRILATW
jgi:hypothetical protein